MKQQKRSKRYLFDAHATAVVGQIIQPFRDVIQVQAGSALPPIGGVGAARVEGFRYREILSVGSAYSEVIGRETSKADDKEGVFETVSLSVVERFNLLDVVTCDRIVSRIASKYQQSTGESSISPEGSHFEGLRIGNIFFDRLEVGPKILWDEAHSSWKGLTDSVEKDRETLERISLLAPDDTRVPLPVQHKAAALGFSIVSVQEGEGKPVGVFSVPRFGTVHLGEFFCHPSARQLTMLRVELGCPVEGELIACDAIADGGDVPP